MLEIKPIEDKQEQEEICRKCGLPYREELFAYKAYDSGKLLAAAHFDIIGEEAVIYGMRQVLVSADDYEAMFILGRAVLNFLDLCGVKTAIYDVTDDYDRKTAKLVGFKETDGKTEIVLTGLFDSPCQHGNSYSKPADES